ncbi:MAG: Rossmann-like and DUF2520 domain-containing protein [Bradymonadaceae bacterium]
MESATDLRGPWVVVGAGRVGRTIALLADRLGVEVSATWNRTSTAADRTAELVEADACAFGRLPASVREPLSDAGVVWLTVADEAVEDVADELSGSIDSGSILLHTCGSMGSEVLGRAGFRAAVGTLHPLLAISDPEIAVDALGDAVWTVEGESEAVGFSRRLIGAIGGEVYRLPEGARPLYHAAAVTAANLLVGVVDAAIEMAERAGLDRTQAREMLLALAESALANVRDHGTEDALTGPVARGDRATVQRHRRALQERAEGHGLLELYDVLTDWVDESLA